MVVPRDEPGDPHDRRAGDCSASSAGRWRCRRSRRASRAASTALAFSIALLWAVHPLNTQAVTYVVQRVESMMSLFLLLTLYFAIRGDQALAVICCALGMATKQTMVGAPVIVLLWDYVFAARLRWKFYLALAATWSILAILLVASARPHSVGAIEGWTPICIPPHPGRRRPLLPAAGVRAVAAYFRLRLAARLRTRRHRAVLRRRRALRDHDRRSHPAQSVGLPGRCLLHRARAIVQHPSRGDGSGDGASACICRWPRSSRS